MQDRIPLQQRQRDMQPPIASIAHNFKAMNSRRIDPPMPSRTSYRDFLSHFYISASGAARSEPCSRKPVLPDDHLMTPSVRFFPTPVPDDNSARQRDSHQHPTYLTDITEVISPAPTPPANNLKQAAPWAMYNMQICRQEWS